MTSPHRAHVSRTRFRLLGVILALFAGFGAAALYAQQVLSQGTSNAFGESVALTFTALPPLASGSATSGPLPTVSGTAPPAYNLTNSLANATVTATTPSVGTVLTTGVLTVNAASSVPGSATTTADATVNNVAQNLAVNLITAFGLNATTVRSTAAVGGACGALTSTGTTTIENGTLIGSLLGASAGASLAVNPAPNTVVGAGAALGTALAAAGITITLNEQIVTGDGVSNRRIIVNAIHIRYNGTLIGGGITTTGDVIIGHSEASVTCAAAPATNADLAVTLTDTPDPVPVGNDLTYTAGVTNNGPASAAATVLSNTLPAGVTFVSATSSQGTCSQSGGVVTCNLGTLASGASATANIVVRPTTPGTLSNTVSATSSTPDPNTANNSATATTTVTAQTAAADLALTKTDSPDPVVVGSNLTYTLSANNVGPGIATGVVVTDQLPAGVTFVSASASQGSCTQAAGTVTCNLGTINAGATATASIVVTVNVAGTLTNTANVSATSTDPTPGNNSATSTTTVSPAPTADLAVTLADNPDPVPVGNDLTYTATVTNNGPSTASAAVFTDTLPAGVTFVSATSSQGTCTQSGGTVTCSLGAIAAGAGATVNIVVRPTAAGALSNTVSATASTPDPNAANNSATATTNVTAATAGADLALTKTDSPDPVIAGGNLTYTLTASNGGPGSATGVVITDQLPAGVTFVSASASQGSCTQAAGTVTCNLGTITAGATATASIVVTTGAAGSLTNTANISSSSTDPTPGNNSATATTTVSPLPAVNADLAVTVTDSPDPVLVGNPLTYTATVTNNGPSTAAGTVLTSTLPAGVTFVQANASQGTCTQSGSVVTCTLGSVAPGSPATVNITVTPNTPGTITYTASATASTPDPTPANNTATATTTVAPQSQAADVALVITDTPDPVPAGNLLTYNITATNNGSVPSTGVVITDTLPAGVTFLSAVTSQGTCTQSGGTVTCAIGTLAPGASANVQINVRPTAPGTVNNTATVVATTPDSNNANNSATASTTVITAPTDEAAADLAVTLVNSGPVAVGGNLTYTATISNAGPGVGTGTVLTFPLPPGATFVSATASQGSCTLTGSIVTCTLGLVAVGVTPTVSIVVRPGSAGTLVATATVTGSTGDPNLANNSATSSAIVGAPVPTMGEWALMLLGGVLLALGYRRVRRQTPLMMA